MIELGGMESELYQKYDDLKCLMYEKEDLIYRKLYIMGFIDGGKISRTEWLV